MDRNDELTRQDRILLEKMDEMLADGSSGYLGDDSILGLCAQFVGAGHQPSPRFQRGLEARLMAKWADKFVYSGQISLRSVWGARLWAWLRHVLNGSNRLFKSRGGLPMRKKLALLLTAVLLMAVVTVAFSPTVQEVVFDVVKRIVFSEYSGAVQVNPSDMDAPPARSEDVWTIDTEIGGFGGNAPPGVDPVVRTVATFEEAQELTIFALLDPAELPEGYALREAKLAPIWDLHWAVLFYGGPGHDIIIAQMPVGPLPSDNPNEVVAVGGGVITDKPLQEVDFDGLTAAWVDEYGLTWEAQGIHYVLGGLDLSLDQALQIARSLH